MVVCIVSLSIVLKGWKNWRYIAICSRLVSLLLMFVFVVLIVFKSLFSVAVCVIFVFGCFGGLNCV